MGDHPFEFIFGPSSPEERERMEKERDQAQMHQQSLRHEVSSFIHELDADGLRILRALIAATTDDTSYGNYVLGQLTALLHIKHNICTACGEDHDKMLLDGTEQLEMFPSHEPDTGAEIYSEKWLDQMMEYGLRVAVDGEIDAREDEKPVLCLECGALFQSLEDRMKRPPGVKGCEGCQNKAKWG